MCMCDIYSLHTRRRIIGAMCHLIEFAKEQEWREQLNLQTKVKEVAPKFCTTPRPSIPHLAPPFPKQLETVKSNCLKFLVFLHDLSIIPVQFHSWALNGENCLQDFSTEKPFLTLVSRSIFVFVSILITLSLSISIYLSSNSVLLLYCFAWT